MGPATKPLENTSGTENLWCAYANLVDRFEEMLQIHASEEGGHCDCEECHRAEKQLYAIDLFMSDWSCNLYLFPAMEAWSARRARGSTNEAPEADAPLIAERS